MQILIADEDLIARRLAFDALARCGVDVNCVESGQAAWQAVGACTQSTVLILGRVTLGLDGLELCRRVRRLPALPPLHIIMVASGSDIVDVTAGLDAGADDYMVKPFNPEELKARVQVGLRVVALQEGMARRLSELEHALASVKQLRGLLPMCVYCKKIRVDDKYWQQLEGYLTERSDAEFTHGICPECFPAALEGVHG